MRLKLGQSEFEPISSPENSDNEEILQPYGDRLYLVKTEEG